MNLHLQLLIKEFLTIYQTLDISDQPEARDHIRDVRFKLGTILNNVPPDRQKEPGRKPVCKYLDAAIEACNREESAGLCNALERINSILKWEFGYTAMPDCLYNSYAFTEVLGPEGNIYSKDIALGFVLLAPHCHYPDHRHHGIEESYLCLSGRVVQNNKNELKSGDFLFNHPGKKHALTAGPDAPCLLAFVWHAEPEILMNYSMEFE